MWAVGESNVEIAPYLPLVYLNVARISFSRISEGGNLDSGMVVEIENFEIKDREKELCVNSFFSPFLYRTNSRIEKERLYLFNYVEYLLIERCDFLLVLLRVDERRHVLLHWIFHFHI